MAYALCHECNDEDLGVCDREECDCKCHPDEATIREWKREDLEDRIRSFGSDWEDR